MHPLLLETLVFIRLSYKYKIGGKRKKRHSILVQNHVLLVYFAILGQDLEFFGRFSASIYK